MFDLLQGFRVVMPVAAIEDFIRASTNVLIFFGVPVTFIVTYQKRKIAEIMSRIKPQNADSNTDRQIAALQSQVANLTTLVQEHIIDNDRSHSAPLEQRLDH